jgi:hypothetical protein
VGFARDYSFVSAKLESRSFIYQGFTIDLVHPLLDRAGRSRISAVCLVIRRCTAFVAEETIGRNVLFGLRVRPPRHT